MSDDAAAADATLDARGLKCPLPVLKTRKRLSALPPGGVLEVWADDPAAIVDMPHFCAEAGHVLLSQEETARDGGPVLVFRLRRGG